MMAFQNVPDGSASGNVHQSIYRKWWFWALAVPFFLFIALLIYRVPFVLEKEKTQEVVAQIHAQKLTLADVNGENLPPPPDPALADATVEGIDANKNGIRDDVELAIFKKYPDSAKIRAAELQLAVVFQMYLTKVSNADTLMAIEQEEERASLCLADQTSRDELKAYYRNLKGTKSRIRYMVINTEEREKRALQNSMIIKSLPSLEGPYCDVNPDSLHK